MALALALSAVPALAQDVDTNVNVTGGTTTPPIIKCKWEQDTTLCLEDGDPTHETAGGQFLPPGVFAGNKTVEYWVVITDPEGVGTVSTVSVDVYHPAGPPECGSKKYQVILEKVDKATVGIPAFEAAWAAGLVTWNPAVFADADEAYADIMSELTKCTAEVYMGEGGPRPIISRRGTTACTPMPVTAAMRGQARTAPTCGTTSPTWLFPASRSTSPWSTTETRRYAWRR